MSADGQSRMEGAAGRESRDLRLEEAVGEIHRCAPGGIVLFAGAGISVSPPASCPTWFRLIESVIKCAAEAHPRIGRLSRCAVDRYGDASKAVKIEAICQILHANLGANFLDALNVLVGGFPNADHRAIAELAKRGSLAAVVTTNFDPYIELALHAEGVAFDVHVGNPPRRVQQALVRAKRDRLPVLKPHGSITEAHSIVLTMRQAGRPASTEIARAIEGAFKKFTVLLVGYSGNDDDLFPAILDWSGSAKRVLWAVWDRNSLTTNAAIFADRCPSCSLVWCDRNSILQKLAPGSHGPSSREPLFRDTNATLRQWAGRLPEAVWTNFFCDLLLNLDHGSIDSQVVAEYAASAASQANGYLITARALRNRAIALMATGDLKTAKPALDEALETYLRAGRSREYTELAVIAAEVFPSRHDQRGRDDPLFMATWYSGKGYEPYSMGLCEYAQGIELEAIGKLTSARSCFLAGAGFARRAGDMTTVRKCLTRLALLADKLGEVEVSARARRQSEVLVQTLSLVDPNEPSGESPILGQCEEAASRRLRNFILGEVLLGIVIQAVGFVAAFFFTHKWLDALGLSGCGAAAYAYGKFRAASRTRDYPDIERT